MEYNEFLKSKVVIAENYGYKVDVDGLNPMLKPHNKDVVLWALDGGRRAIFLNFGLHKTFTQLEIAKQTIDKTNKPFLIVCPLAVAGEFKRDRKKFNVPYEITYITDTDKIDSYEPQIFITNYERVRMGDIDASKFGGVSFDEASILRNLQTETTNYVIKHFQQVEYRFVATASPAPNDYIEILNYAVFLNVASRGHLLTRFFQRDSTKAGSLTLYPNKAKEFWQWVSTWAVFVSKPSDLGYSNEGYDLPPLKTIEYCVESSQEESYVNKFGELVMFRDTKGDFTEKAREKRESIKERCDKAFEIAIKCKSAIIWHELESERIYLERLFKNHNAKSVYGSQSNKLKEDLLIGFSEGGFNYLITKKRIAGSGCNFQEYCHDQIFCSLDDKFNDWIQAIHRSYRFGQKYPVNIHLVYTKEQHKTLQNLYRKWRQHNELQDEMISIIKEFGLNSQIIKSQMERQIFSNGRKLIYDNVTLYNNDTVIVHQDKKEMPDNSVDLYLTSIPFGDHYEYSDNYNDFGHNHGNEKFFEQMDFLTPNMLRCLKPGRIAAIHVKDRIRYSYQNGTSFTTIADFSGQTVAHYVKHGFYLIGKITVTTDVVAENNQTYRLGWSEQCKDASKMGVGLPEYVLLFRKAPTSMDNSYSDEPVQHSKEEYTKALWQLDAHSYQRSNGNRFLTRDELQSLDMKKIVAAWKKYNQTEIYDFQEHLRVCEDLDEMEKLSSTFMTLPVHSNSDMVWSDINRMNTLNAKQVNGKKEKHICPLQFDIIERLINRYSMKSEVVCDPFGGLFSTAYKALEMGRKSISIELNSEYFNDGVFYVKAMIHKLSIPTLFDFNEPELLTEAI
jgi:DNA modification methylase